MKHRYVILFTAAAMLICSGNSVYSRYNQNTKLCEIENEYVGESSHDAGINKVWRKDGRSCTRYPHELKDPKYAGKIKVKDGKLLRILRDRGVDVLSSNNGGPVEVQNVVGGGKTPITEELLKKPEEKTDKDEKDKGIDKGTGNK